jgi:hypothetical protein
MERLRKVSKPLANAQSTQPFRPNRGKWPNASLVRTIRIQHSTSKCPCLGVFVRECDHFIEGTVVDEGVRVQDEHVLALARLDSDIVSLREPKIAPVFDQPNPWKLLANKLDRSVGRSVVGNNNLELRRVRLRENRREAIADHF